MNAKGSIVKLAIKPRTMLGTTTTNKSAPTERRTPASLNIKMNVEEPISDVIIEFKINQLLFLELRIKVDIGY